MDFEGRLRVLRGAKAQREQRIAEIRQEIARLEGEGEHLVAVTQQLKGGIMELELILQQGEQDAKDTVDEDRPGGDNGDSEGTCDSDRTAGDEGADESVPLEE